MRSELDSTDHCAFGLWAKEGTLPQVDRRAFPSPIITNIMFLFLGVNVIVCFCLSVLFHTCCLFGLFFSPGVYFSISCYLQSLKSHNVVKYSLVSKVVSYNVNVLGKHIKRSKIMSKLKREGKEVGISQEPYLSQLEHEKLRKWKFN